MARTKEADAARKREARAAASGDLPLKNWHEKYKHLTDEQVAGLPLKTKGAYNKALSAAMGDPAARAEMQARVNAGQSAGHERMLTTMQTVVAANEREDRPRGPRSQDPSAKTFPDTVTVVRPSGGTIEQPRRSQTRFQRVNMRAQAENLGVPNLELPAPTVATGSDQADVDPITGQLLRANYLLGGARTKYVDPREHQLRTTMARATEAGQVDMPNAPQRPEITDPEDPNFGYVPLTGRQAMQLDLSDQTTALVQSQLMGTSKHRTGGNTTPPRGLRDALPAKVWSPSEGAWVHNPDITRVQQSLRIIGGPGSSEVNKARQVRSSEGQMVDRLVPDPQSRAVRRATTSFPRAAQRSVPLPTDTTPVDPAVVAAQEKVAEGLYSGQNNEDVTERRYVVHRGMTLPAVPAQVFEFSGQDAPLPGKGQTAGVTGYGGAPIAKVTGKRPTTSRIVHVPNPEQMELRRFATSEEAVDAEGNPVVKRNAVTGEPVIRRSKEGRPLGLAKERVITGTAPTTDPHDYVLKEGGDPSQAYIAYEETTTPATLRDMVSMDRYGTSAPSGKVVRKRLGFGRLPQSPDPVVDADSPAELNRQMGRLKTATQLARNVKPYGGFFQPLPHQTATLEDFVEFHNGDVAKATQHQEHVRSVIAADKRAKFAETPPHLMKHSPLLTDPSTPQADREWAESTRRDAIANMHVTPPNPVAVQMPPMKPSARGTLAKTGGFASSAEQRANDMKMQASLDAFSPEDRAVVISKMRPGQHEAHQERMAGYAAEAASASAAAEKAAADKVAAKARLEASYPPIVRKGPTGGRGFPGGLSQADADFADEHLSSGQFTTSLSGDEAKFTASLSGEDVGARSNYRTPGGYDPYEGGYQEGYWD